ncbi:hypothetical protein KAZ57_02915, partial [Patescibacteria group bacterium]|nr:hypothetical protein [Patescibacteria group bacterium]
VFLIIILADFFIFFGKYHPRREFNSNVSLYVALSAESVGVEDIKSRVPITVNYSAKNESSSDYVASKYFYRILLSRAYDTSGFVLKEFSKDLKTNNSFAGTYIWIPETIPANGGTFKMYFNLYKEVAFSDPILISSSEASIVFPEEK